MKTNLWYHTSFIGLTIGVVLGAFGAHALKKSLAPESLQAWQTGIQYHFVHCLGLLGVARYTATSRGMLWSARLLLVGLICFSGSLYLLACKSLLPFSVDILGPITPIGGLCWVAAWILAAVAFPRKF